MSIEITGLEETKATLNKLQNLDKVAKDICRELCEMAQRVVESKYSVWSYAGNDDWQTEIEELPDGFRLVAYGEDVGFLEFGAGVFTNEDEFASQVGYAIHPGSWSESQPHGANSKYFAKDGFWIWNSVKFTGITPSRGMHYALEEIMNHADEVAKRKIDEWIHGK